MSEGLAAVVLAGGLSLRFGSNKLLYKVGDETMLGRVWRVVSETVDSVYLSVRSAKQASILGRVCGVKPANVIIDDKSLGCSGPVAGILSTALKAGTRYLLTIPADMPFIEKQPLKRFIEIYLSSNTRAAAILDREGVPTTLLQLHETSWILDNGLKLSRIKFRTPRASDLLRFAPSLLLVGAGLITEKLGTLKNVNTPQDLESMEEIGGLPRKLLRLACGWRGWRGVLHFHDGMYGRAAQAFLLEGEYYRSLGLGLLAAHSNLDAWISWMISANL